MFLYFFFLGLFLIKGIFFLNEEYPSTSSLLWIRKMFICANSGGQANTYIVRVKLFCVQLRNSLNSYLNPQNKFP